jgi:hypothetical protein
MLTAGCSSKMPSMCITATYMPPRRLEQRQQPGYGGRCAYAKINSDGSLQPFQLSAVFPDTPADQAISATRSWISAAETPTIT